MAECECNIAAMFPHLGGHGIISANLRSNTQIIITSELQILIGPSLGELSITGYAATGEIFECPGRAGVSYEWVQKYDCLADKIYFVPRGGDRAYIEGEVSSSVDITSILTSTGFSASASSGPHTVYLDSRHEDGHSFSYSAGPIAVTGRDVDLSIISSLLPNGDAYLTTFSWEQTPPNIPTVSYSFIFAGQK